MGGAIPNAPFLYFAARAGTYDDKQQYQISGGSSCRPYIDARVATKAGAAPTYINPQTFQILCPGLDGKYGFGRRYPTGEDYTIPDQMDDMTNFTKGTIGDDMP